MGLILLVARVLLALVFGVAGLAKLADRAGARQALRDFGVPAALAAPLGLLLPLAELAVALALLPTRSAWWGAQGALVLLLLFVAGIAASLARGRTPECHCFGQLHSAPAGWPTLTRNAVLAAVAGLVVWQGRANAGPSAVRWLGSLTAGQWVGLAVGLMVLALLAGEGWLVLNLVQQNGRLLVRLETVEARLGLGNTGLAMGLPIGSSAPSYEMSGLDGKLHTLDALRATGKPLLLRFSDPDCGPHSALLPEIGCCWQLEHAALETIQRLSLRTQNEWIAGWTCEANDAPATEHRVRHPLKPGSAERLENKPWRFRARDASAFTFPSAIDAQFIIDGKPIFIPKGTMLGRLDFYPNRRTQYIPEDRSKAIVLLIEAFESLFKCMDMAKQPDINVKLPSYLIADTKEKRMARFVQRLGFNIIDLNELGYTIIAETDTVRRNHAVLKARGFRGSRLEEWIIKRAEREEERLSRSSRSQDRAMEHE